MAIEQHYSPQELAALSCFSTNLIRDMFRNEPGVIVLSRPEGVHKRGYESIRIPESVANLVLDRLRVKASRSPRKAA